MTETTPPALASGSDQTRGPAPDIGDTFTREGYGPRSFAVTAWLKRARPEPLPPELAELLAELPHVPPPLLFCVREEAEYVAAHGGGCGLLVAVAEVSVTGRADWPAEHYDHARHRAATLVGVEVHDYPAR